MLCPVESNLPKANISSSGGLIAYSTHPKAVPLFLICHSVWSTGTEASARSFLMIWGHQLKTEAAWEPSTESLCDWVRKELHQKNSKSIIQFESFLSIFSHSAVRSVCRFRHKISTIRWRRALRSCDQLKYIDVNMYVGSIHFYLLLEHLCLVMFVNENLFSNIVPE